MDNVFFIGVNFLVDLLGVVDIAWGDFWFINCRVVDSFSSCWNMYAVCREPKLFFPLMYDEVSASSGFYVIVSVRACFSII